MGLAGRIVSQRDTSSSPLRPWDLFSLVSVLVVLPVGSKVGKIALWRPTELQAARSKNTASSSSLAETIPAVRTLKSRNS